jgi:hypothetical protein
MMGTGDKDGARRRAAPRIKIFQPAEIQWGRDAPRRVHLLNISTGGALLYGDEVPAVGSEVRLACGIPLGSARVQWIRKQRFGVAFANPLGAAQIDAIVRLHDELIQAMTQRLGPTAVR